MRKIMLIICALAAFAASPALAAGAGLNVAVGVGPVARFAQMIGGDKVRATVLVPAGADAHTYEPKPSQMRGIASSTLYLSVGLEFEEAWEARLKGANPKLVFVHLEDGLKLMPMPEGHEEHGHGKAAKAGHHDEMDPHVWVAPSMARQMCGTIAAAFAKADPANAKVYAANLAAVQKRIDALDAQFKTMFSAVPAGKRGFMVFHPAWGYFARDYGLTQTAIEFEGKEPTPRRLTGIVTRARELGVRAIFIQPQMSRRAAETIAKAVGARLVVADPLAEDWEANLQNVAAEFREALK